MSYTADFALVCEGVTDYAVLKNILIGFFREEPRAPRITQKQPDTDATGEAGWQTFGNWENVFRYLREGLYEEALEYNKYLVVQVDTDASEHANFGVPQQEGGTPLSPEAMVERVAEKLREIIGAESIEKYRGRMIFAICVRDVECWILPLWEVGAKAAKTTGCLQTLNAVLAQKNEPTISENKKVPPYENASKGYRKRATLVADGPRNPSLAVFLRDLEGRNIKLTALEESDDIAQIGEKKEH